MGKTQSPKDKAAKTRRRVDWDAIERDYRTDKFTLRELGARHKTDHATIARKIKRDQTANPDSWQKDLTSAVRQATNAKLVTAMVTKQVNKGQQDVTNAVLAAAEVNKDVILRHRSDLVGARDTAIRMLGELDSTTLKPGELAEMFDTFNGFDDKTSEEVKRALRQRFNDHMRLHNRVGSVHKLADTLAKLQASERKAFGLDEADGGVDDRELSELELAAKMAHFLDIGRRRAGSA